MTAEQLRSFKNKEPFKPFRIHLADGTAFDINDPESLAIHPDWTVDAIVLMPRGRFSFIYLKNVTHVTGEGTWPKFKRRRGRKNDSDGD